MHSNHSENTDIQAERHSRRSGAATLIGRFVLIVVLGLAFVGYTTPGMRIQWANLMTLCGF